MFFSWRPIKNDSVTPYVSFDKNDSVTPHVSFDKYRQCYPLCFFPMMTDEEQQLYPLYFIWEGQFLFF